MKIHPISEVRAHTRCPRCAHRAVRRSSIVTNILDISNYALWDFIETCIMCPWSKTTSNVKVGA